MTRDEDHVHDPWTDQQLEGENVVNVHQDLYHLVAIPTLPFRATGHRGVTYLPCERPGPTEVELGRGSVSATDKSEQNASRKAGGLRAH